MNIKYLNPNKSYSEYGVFSLDAIKNRKSISVVAFSDVNTIYNKEICIPHKHDFYSIMWVKEGSLTQVVDGETYVWNKGTIALGQPRSVLQFKSYSAPFEAICVCVPESMFCMIDCGLVDFLKHEIFGRNVACMIDDKDDYRNFSNAVGILQKECSRGNTNLHDLHMQATIFSYLALSLRHSIVCEPHPVLYSENKFHHEIYLGFLRLMEEHFREERKVDFYAGKLNVGKWTLERSVKECCGKTPFALLTKRRMAEAKYLIAVEKKSLKEISAELCFDEYSHFSSTFKRVFGVSPDDFVHGLMGNNSDVEAS